MVNRRLYCRRCCAPKRWGLWCIECVATWAWGLTIGVAGTVITAIASEAILGWFRK